MSNIQNPSTGGGGGGTPGGNINDFQFNLDGSNFGGWSATQATAQLNLFTSTLKGLVPLSGGGTLNYLRADGSWVNPKKVLVVAGINDVYYVSTTGNDSNTGLSLGQAWLTLQHAADYILENLIIETQNVPFGVYVVISDGTYVESLTLNQFEGSGYVYFYGNAVTPTNTEISGSGANIVVICNGGQWNFQHVQLGIAGSGAAAANIGLSNGPNAWLTFFNCFVGSTSGGHFSSTYGAFLGLDQISINGTGTIYMHCREGGYIEHNHDPLTLLIDPGWASACVFADRGGFAFFAPSVVTGTSTGKMYAATQAAKILLHNTPPGTGTGIIDQDCVISSGDIIAPTFIGDSGTGGKIGYVPAPVAGDAAANKVLGAGGGWVTQSGASGITINTTTITGGTTLRVLYDNAGTVGEYANAQLTAILDQFTTTLQGVVPGSGGGTVNFLRADGTWAAPGGSPMIVDTIANILATTPTSGLTAYATDIAQTLVANGTTWLLDSSYSTAVALPDLGGIPYSNRLGYGSNYVTDKRLANVFFGTSALTEEGGIRHNDAIQALQAYLNGTWKTLTAGVALREENSILEHLPNTVWIQAYSGNSVGLIGLNGRPIVQNYEVSLGAYPPEPVIDGGTF